MENLTSENIILINKLCLKEGERNIVLSQNRLLSALSNQYQPYDCDEKRIASLYKALILDHAFENGNKRTAVIALAYLASSINQNISLSDEELCDLTYKIADAGGSQIEVDYLSKIIFNMKCDKKSSNSLFDFVILFCNNHKWLINKLGE